MTEQQDKQPVERITHAQAAAPLVMSPQPHREGRREGPAHRNGVRDPDPSLDLEQVGARLGVTGASVRFRAARGTTPHTRIGKRI